MNSILLYLIKANIVLSILFISYMLLFRKTTFHRLNRGVLLSILMISLLAPLWSYQFNSISVIELPIDTWLFDGDNYTMDTGIIVEQIKNISLISVQNIIGLVYLVVLSVLIVRFIRQLCLIILLRKKSLRSSYNEGVYIMDKEELAAFSFYRWIFLPRNFNEHKNHKYIFKHEQAHINQLHTLDIVFIELFSLVFWFNPLIYLLKSSLKTVHEYLADEAAVKSVNDKIEYLKLLSTGVCLVPSIGISSSFYWLTIKKRIDMITKNKTSRIRKISYLLLLPMVAIIIQSFSAISIRTSGILKSEMRFADEIPGISPIEAEKSRISSAYGMRIHPINKVEKMHYAIDLSAEKGTPVVATADGIVAKVEFIEQGKGYGRVVVIKHGEVYSTLYAQLSEFKVKVNDKVKQGQIVGLVGSSGISTGSHLHYEVHKSGERVNPEDYMP